MSNDRSLWARECELFGSLKDTALPAFHDRALEAWEHKAVTAAELLGSIAVGAALSVASKNPDMIMAKVAAPVVRTLELVGAVDIGRRIGMLGARVIPGKIADIN